MRVAAKHGLARALSKLGVCSRTQAAALIVAGRVSVNGRVQIDPEYPTDWQHDRLAVDDRVVSAGPRMYIAMNKPRGLIVTSTDERGRDTIYSLLREANLPWLAPVGRLDKASEGLLLLSNDTAWAARITEPAHQVHKTYRVQISGLPDASLLSSLVQGIDDDGETLRVVSATLLRSGEKNAWLEIVLDEGRNRHIRRMLSALNHDVIRLIRVGIGSLQLGTLAKGAWRHLSADEINALNN